MSNKAFAITLLKGGIKAIEQGHKALAVEAFSLAVEFAKEEYQRTQRVFGYTSSKTNDACDLLKIARTFELSPTRAIKIFGGKL